MFGPEYKIIDKNTNEVLFTFPIEEKEKAFLEAKNLETFDLDIELIGPTLPEELILSLGASSSDLAKLDHELNTEINEHPASMNSCCFKQDN